MPQVRVGTDVHFVVGKECRTARVTALPTPREGSRFKFGDVVSLVVFGPASLAFPQTVEYDLKVRTGTWHWPDTCSGGNLRVSERPELAAVRVDDGDD